VEENKKQEKNKSRFPSYGNSNKMLFYIYIVQTGANMFYNHMEIITQITTRQTNTTTKKGGFGTYLEE
jgi:hypothetical protein